MPFLLQNMVYGLSACMTRCMTTCLELSIRRAWSGELLSRANASRTNSSCKAQSKQAPRRACGTSQSIAIDNSSSSSSSNTSSHLDVVLKVVVVYVLALEAFQLLEDATRRAACVVSWPGRCAAVFLLLLHWSLLDTGGLEQPDDRIVALAWEEGQHCKESMSLSLSLFLYIYIHTC